MPSFCNIIRSVYGENLRKFTTSKYCYTNEWHFNGICWPRHACPVGLLAPPFSQCRNSHYPPQRRATLAGKNETFKKTGQGRLVTNIGWRSSLPACAWEWKRNSQSILRVHDTVNSLTTTTTTTTTTMTILWPFVRDYPGELVPEETLTHPPSWSSSNLYQLLPSTTIHNILLVQITCLAIF